MLVPRYTTTIFKDIKCVDETKKWDNANNFLTDWKTSYYYIADNSLVTDNNVKVIWALLFSKYGNSPIANSDDLQFKNKVWTVMFQYAPTWQKELAIQKKLRDMDLDSGAIFEGTGMIYNHSYNPSTAPSTSTLDELTTIDDQNTTHYKKSKLDGLNALDELLKTDVTEAFINKFRKLFKQFVAPEYYEYVEEENE